MSNEGRQLAAARDDFFKKRESLLDLSTIGSDPKYLRNRLEAAFIAGWDARAGVETTVEEPK